MLVSVDVCTHSRFVAVLHKAILYSDFFLYTEKRQGLPCESPWASSHCQKLCKLLICRFEVVGCGTGVPITCMQC